MEKVLVELNSVPEWLKTSEIYKNKTFLIEPFLLKKTSEITNINEFIQVMAIVYHWNINYPESVYDYISKNRQSCIIALKESCNSYQCNEFLNKLYFNNTITFSEIDNDVSEMYFYYNNCIIGKFNISLVYDDDIYYGFSQLVHSLKNNINDKQYITKSRQIISQNLNKYTNFVWIFKDKVLSFAKFNYFSEDEYELSDFDYKDCDSVIFISINEFNKKEIMDALELFDNKFHELHELYKD